MHILNFTLKEEIVMFKLPSLSLFKGESYLAGQFRQIKHSLAEQFRQMKRSLVEQFRQIKRTTFNVAWRNRGVSIEKKTR